MIFAVFNLSPLTVCEDNSSSIEFLVSFNIANIP